MKIENQAMMFAFLSKNAIELCDEEGREVIQQGMTRYGNERGMRMAKRAVANGDPIALWTNQAYGEWRPDYDGQMCFGALGNEPTYRTYISKCAWCDAWKKNDILEYGKEYCVNVDNAVYQGFCGDFKCTPVGASMSHGGEQCVFDWGFELTDEDKEKLAAKKTELGTSAMEDFDFHTAHIYYTVTDAIRKGLPEKAEEIIEKAVEEYIELFGQEDYDKLLEFRDVDWTEVR